MLDSELPEATVYHSFAPYQGLFCPLKTVAFFDQDARALTI
jgi:hypothetical protein